jgi:hypothetical protein
VGKDDLILPNSMTNIVILENICKPWKSQLILTLPENGVVNKEKINKFLWLTPKYLGG